jgi:hypothetical protein
MSWRRSVELRQEMHKAISDEIANRTRVHQVHVAAMETARIRAIENGGSAQIAAPCNADWEVGTTRTINTLAYLPTSQRPNCGSRDICEHIGLLTAAQEIQRRKCGSGQFIADLSILGRLLALG